MKGKKVVVTGGAGFIGSHVVDALIKEGAEVTVVDDFRSGSEDNLEKVMDKVRLIRADVSSKECEIAIKDADIVYHLAAIASVSKSVEDPIYTHEVNVNGMLKVLEAARKAGVKRFVFVSSAAVYGSSPVIPTKESEPFSPESPYALHKIIAEEYLSIYSKLYNMETVALRYFNVYGSRQKPDSPYSGVISIFMNKAKSGEKITIEGDGEQTRDFVHVSDVAKATVCAGSVDGISTEVLNIGSGEEISINILAETINKITGNSAGTVHVESRVGDVRNSVSDSSRAREVLGWKSEIFHEEGLKQLAGA